MALTKFNFNSFDLTTAASKGLAFNSSANGFETSTAGSMVLIKTITISSGTASAQFAHGSSDVVFDSTYPVYLFKYISVHGANEQELCIDFSDSAGSDYDLLHQTTFFRHAHNEAGNDGNTTYVTSRDLANSGSKPFLTVPIGTESDNSGSGELYVFNPSSTTFVTHFISRGNISVGDGSSAGSYSQNSFVAGYVNTTAAITAMKFQMDSGNIDSGIFKMYGIKDS